jgi:hypothetical protein
MKPAFIIGAPNKSDSAASLYIRKRIRDQFNGGANNWPLQCTEGAAFFLLYNHGITIEWPVKYGRHGGLWPAIFEHFKMFCELPEPHAGGTVHFTSGLGSKAVNEIGHVAYVQKVNKAGDIFIKEFNWPNSGKYNERWVTRDQWQNKYKARFIRYQ